jgi:hypothetical protein
MYAVWCLVVKRTSNTDVCLDGGSFPRLHRDVSESGSQEPSQAKPLHEEGRREDLFGFSKQTILLPPLLL